MSFETNANKLPWAQDPHGFVSNLRREGCRSIGRIMGDDKKMDIFMDTLRILAKYGAAKKEEQMLINALSKQRRVEQIGETTSRNINDANAIERQLQAELDSVDRRLSAVRSRRAQAEAEKSVVQAAGVADEVRDTQQTRDGIGTAK